MTLKLIMVVLGAFLLAAQASAEQTLILKTQKERQSYAMGVELARNWKEQKVDFDPQVVARGLNDASAGGRLLLTEEDIKTTLQLLAAQVRVKKAQDRTIAQLDNKKKGETFLAENKTKEGVVTLPSGLQYQILKVGDGKKPTQADTVECRIRGTHIDGTEFENSGAGPKSFKVSEAIPAWREALEFMPEGSKWRLFIPPQLAYGQRGSGKIGPYETIIYEIELIDIN